jgi:hypothetical protein
MAVCEEGESEIVLCESVSLLDERRQNSRKLSICFLETKDILWRIRILKRRSGERSYGGGPFFLEVLETCKDGE